MQAHIDNYHKVFDASIFPPCCKATGGMHRHTLTQTTHSLTHSHTHTLTRTHSHRQLSRTRAVVMQVCSLLSIKQGGSNGVRPPPQLQQFVSPPSVRRCVGHVNRWAGGWVDVCLCVACPSVCLQSTSGAADHSSPSPVCNCVGQVNRGVCVCVCGMAISVFAEHIRCGRSCKPTSSVCMRWAREQGGVCGMFASVCTARQLRQIVRPCKPTSSVCMRWAREQGGGCGMFASVCIAHQVRQIVRSCKPTSSVDLRFARAQVGCVM